jgi:c(7)-type cytochrome triheme protein
MNRGFVLTVLAIFVVLPFLSSCTPYPPSTTRGAKYEVESGEGAGVGKRWKDNRYFAMHVKTTKLETDGIHDPKNPAIHSLQEPADAMGSFPIDRRGLVDWVKALDLGLINPRADLQGKTKMHPLDLDIIFKKTGKMPWVKFPHIVHTKWLACSNCHPKIFIEKKGANKFGMDDVLAGKYCGRCHDKVAFALWTCERCHSVPHEGTPERWREYMGVRPQDKELNADDIPAPEKTSTSKQSPASKEEPTSEPAPAN